MEHYPVMAEAVLEYMPAGPEAILLDATAGLGGHTRLLAERLRSGVVIANDRDAESLEKARQNTAGVADRVRFHRGTFRTLDRALAANGYEKADGILADLGVSRYQLTDPERGFSLSADGPLDMRLDRGIEGGVTAGDLVNYAAERELADLLFRLGEERRSRRIARAIVRGRPIRSSLHLADVVERAVPRTSRLHPATQTFMALRRAVNDEEGELRALLEIAPGLLPPGGRLVVISFMSLEDRLVKQAFRELARSGRGTLLTKHVVKPTEDEVRANPASRSAVLRALEKK
jgi:16S rRNA (cytosine1402-N4)-methyltransferase